MVLNKTLSLLIFVLQGHQYYLITALYFISANSNPLVCLFNVFLDEKHDADVAIVVAMFSDLRNEGREDLNEKSLIDYMSVLNGHKKKSKSNGCPFLTFTFLLVY